MQQQQQAFDQGGYDQPSLNMDQLQFTTLLQQQQQQQQQSSIDSPMSNPYDLRSGVPSQYLLPQQLGAFNTAPQYYQDPYTLGIPIQASTAYMQPTYYGMAPTHNLLYHQIQQQQVQQLGSSPGTLTGLTTQNSSLMNKQNGRPATPQQQNSQDQNQMNPYAQQSSFSYYPPGPYTTFDPTGGASAAQLMMSNSRNLNSNVRLISPMLINANTNQSNSKSSLNFKFFNYNYSFTRFYSKQ